MERVFHGGEFRLDTGLSVRLAGLDVPGRGEAGGEQAQAALSRLLTRREVALLYGGPRRDGFGQAVAQVRTVRDRRWVQGRLLGAGLARVRTQASDRALAREMLVLEAGARARRRGMWAGPAWRVLLPGEVLAGFVIVEGRMGAAERTREGWGLEIGRGTGLTAELPRRASAEFAAAGLPVESLAGRLVRLRGTVRPAFEGHRLELDHPEQIELLRVR